MSLTYAFRNPATGQQTKAVPAENGFMRVPVEFIDEQASAALGGAIQLEVLIWSDGRGPKTHKIELGDFVSSPGSSRF